MSYNDNELLCNVLVFDDLESAAEFRSQLPKEDEFSDEIWEFKSLPIVAFRELPNSVKNFIKNYPKVYARIIGGLDFCIFNKVDAINLSIGPSVGNDLDLQHDPLVLAIEKCLSEGIIIVTAAGNAGPYNDTLAPLAKIPSVISVGAVDHNEVLLPISSRGQEGGLGPTVVSHGSPGVVFIKTGRADPMPSTSFATPKVTKVAIVMMRTLQLLWGNYKKIDDLTWDGFTTPLTIPIMGLLDTGVDGSLCPPLPDQVADHLSTNGEFVSFPADDRQRRWFERVHEVCHSYPMVGFNSSVLRQALETIATPLPSHEKHEVGAGLVDYSQCIEFLSTITPSKFIRLFCPSDYGAEIAQENAYLDNELGNLWDLSYVQMLMLFFYDGCRLIVAKVA
ncbi:MAG: S8 family serine peptidase [Ferruginibacter sp.]